ncbi:MAG: hypothetical protein FWB72_05140 [Firmicutes bacterium]|nr:hypothetical protein [Bacillota bacterium]
MSFFINNKAENVPGLIKGNPLYGLCEKVVIQANKVFDAALRQITQQNVHIKVKDKKGEKPVYPVTFISAKSASSKGIVKNLKIERLPERTNFARIRCDVEVPLDVVYVDCQGVEFVGHASITIPCDVVMFVPEASMVPYEIEATVSAICPDGIYVEGHGFKVETCVTIILKVIVPVELLIPSYGYARIPCAQDFSQETCNGFFDLPLYPV